MPAPEATVERRAPLPRWGRIAFFVVALAFAVLALAAQWDDVRTDVDDLSPLSVLGSIAAGVAALGASFLAWRETLAGVAGRIPLRPAARIFFLGQIAKYVPGSVWAIASQVELGRAHGIRRERTAAAGILVLVISLSVALTYGLLSVPRLFEEGGARYTWVFGLLVPLAVVLHPRVVTKLVGLALRLLKRPPLDTPVTHGLVWRVAGLSAISNGLLGVQLWILVRDLGPESAGWQLFAVVLGAYGIAASASFIVVPLPAGAGLREATLVLLLAPEIGAAGATLVAVIVRLTLTIGDLAAAGTAAALGGAADAAALDAHVPASIDVEPAPTDADAADRTS